MGSRRVAEQLCSEVDKVKSAFDRAVSDGGFSAIERDIVLGRLRIIYDALHNIEVVVPPAVETVAESVCNCTSDNAPVNSEPETEPEAQVSISVTEEISAVFTIPAPIDRNIIDSLYACPPLATKEDECGECRDIPGYDAQEQDTPAADEAPRPVHHEEKVLGEIISQGSISFNETITVSAGADIASLLSSQSVTDIRGAIGLNDSFLLIRELFGGDKGLYEATLDRLDSFSNADDAYIYLQENFSLDPDNEGVSLLVTLIERKFS